MFFKTNILFVSYLSSLAFAAVHEIAVGNGGLTFDPENVQTAEGDILIFRLYPNHDVVQGDFGSPCTPSDGGFYSGPFSDTDGGEQRFVVNVTSDEPHYWYCSVQRHCQQGMVGGANVPENGDETIDAYKEAAAGVQQAETPSQRTGGDLVEEDDLDEITSTAGSPSATSSASPSGSDAPTTTSGGEPSNTDAAATASSSAAADTIVVSGGATGILGLVIGIAGFFM